MCKVFNFFCSRFQVHVDQNFQHMHYMNVFPTQLNHSKVVHRNNRKNVYMTEYISKSDHKHRPGDWQIY